MTRNRGFTLIELMIVIAIIGILAGIAYPSYLSAMRDARRTTAEGDLIGLANFMERHYTTNLTYVGATLPFNTSPKNDSSVFYDLSVAIPSAVSFTLTATPRGSQASDYCGELTLDDTEVKGADETGCW